MDIILHISPNSDSGSLSGLFLLEHNLRLEEPLSCLSGLLLFKQDSRLDKSVPSPTQLVLVDHLQAAAV